MADTSWVTTEEDDDLLYAEAHGLGADNFILSCKRRVLKFIETKKAQATTHQPAGKK